MQPTISPQHLHQLATYLHEFASADYIDPTLIWGITYIGSTLLQVTYVDDDPYYNDLHNLYIEAEPFLTRLQIIPLTTHRIYLGV